MGHTEPRKMKDLLGLITDETVSDEMIEQAETDIGEKTVGEIGGMEPLDIVALLTSVTQRKRLLMAEAIIALLTRLKLRKGDSEATAAPVAAPTVAAPAMPTELVIKEQETPASMTLRRLLAELANPASAHEEDEILPFVLGSSDYRTALTYTEDLAVQKVMEGSTDGKLVLDGAATYDYIREVLEDGADAVVEEINDHPVVTLEEALGKTRQIPVSAFLGRGVPPKPDKYGIAWGEMDETLHRAMLAAAAAGTGTGYDLLPKTEGERRVWGRDIKAGRVNDDMTDLVAWYNRQIARGAKAPERFAIRQPRQTGSVVPPFTGSRRPHYRDGSAW